MRAHAPRGPGACPSPGDVCGRPADWRTVEGRPYGTVKELYRGLVDRLSAPPVDLRGSRVGQNVHNVPDGAAATACPKFSPELWQTWDPP